MLIDQADEVGFDAFTFQNLHAVLSQDLMHDPHASGRLRRTEYIAWQHLVARDG